MPKTELYGAATCPYTREMREWLEWNGRDFIEYDVNTDPAALERVSKATNGQRSVPVLLEDGKPVQIGWRGRACFVMGAG